LSAQKGLDRRRQHQNVRVEDNVQFGDLPEFVDEDFSARVARLDAAMLTYLANAPESPQNPVILNELIDDAHLQWTASADGDTGYEILWRPTASAHWEGLMDAGTATSMTLQMNKDNVFFGIRSYNSQGYRSPVVSFRLKDCTLVPVGMGPASVCPPM
jgi:hypothetical protein